jgi:hypothetical protein
MFGVVLLFLITVMHIYVFWRGASVPLLQHHVPRRFLFAAGALLWLGFFCGRVIGHQGTGALAGALETMTVIVCRGTGTWGPRMRLWHPAEIVRVRLQRAE